MPPRQEKRTISRSLAAKRMRGGIAYGICFGLDDTPAHTPFREIVNEGLSDQVARQFDGVDGEFAAPKPAQLLPALRGAAADQASEEGELPIGTRHDLF